MSIKSGQMRHRIKLQRPSRELNDLGEQVITWETYATVWASVENTVGAESVRDGRPTSEGTFSVTIRGRDDVYATHRVLFKTYKLNIESIEDADFTGTKLVLNCRAGV